MNVNYDELILLVGGAFLLVLGIGKRNEREKLLKTGFKVEGVVFDIEKSWSVIDGVVDDGVSGRNFNYYPIIRYVTLEKEWVTKKYEIGTNPSTYNIGDKVTVIYDAMDIEHFIIDNYQTKLAGLIFIVVGVTLIMGVIMYFFINQYSSL
jgi:hypothetical protein